ncbi:lysophospholipid acyltransferase family protein [Spirulina sp. CS-785/01]|uniref:lysophospholipid acyltransferase family protein n=1 Tax=Spirulina sp. CS-785/01 TaxID=3021716 RepID=UPI00232EBE09|nr:lysophospholipid acyltransferase family protein [Spirulina sp. CS-785/01]MDB9315668.1 lysophospholipid acyltransferase family protein [Spirulina sp. CS-785/01]
MVQSQVRSNPSSITSQISPWLARLAYPLGACVVLPTYFGKITVTGQENLPPTGPVILAPTHRSRWDGLVMPYAAGKLVTGRYLRFMVSANEMTGLQGWFIRRLGGFPVDSQKLRLETVHHSVELLCDGEMITIFPEGNIYRQPKVEPLKRGVAAIALQAQAKLPDEVVKIVPISIHYSDPYPQWGTDVQVAIGQPLAVSQYNLKTPKSSSKQLTQNLENALRRLHEVEALSPQQDMILTA